MTLSGMAAMGHPVPANRRDAAYTLLKEWEFDSETAMTFVGQLAECLERDKPNEAMAVSNEFLNFDLTCTYRLMAVLLTEPQ